MYKILKCLEHLREIEFLPYEGGPIAAIKVISSKYFHSLVSISYHPPRSKCYLIISKGG